MTTRHSSAAPAVARRGERRPDLELVHDSIEAIPRFRGRQRTVTPLDGGLTNRNFRVDVAATASVVVRVSAGKSALLSIDRAAECHNARAAATVGVGPAVHDCRPADGITVVEWINGRTFDSADLDDPGSLDRVAALCRELHAGPRFVNDFDMFAIQRSYEDVVREHGFRLPARYLDFAPQVARIRGALGTRTTVPCHNDLLAANILDDGVRLWFIDYEYSGNNDAFFELGNIWSEASLEADRLEHLVTAYVGARSPSLVARARLLALMSKYGWTLWASIQDAVSDVDFDFWSWGMEKYDRAVAEFDSPELDRLIDEVQQIDRPRGSHRSV